ncbi:hypothetical protein [Hydrocarboniphaga sp.]|uniref:hypothetical protein n=1 Tax=Hydrocarboniphaga sp. TaxID=2033016 RepID=UPI003D0C27F3
MMRDTLLRPWLITLMCLALVIARVSGAHLHMCFDGNEPPVTFHLTDQGPHHDGADAKAHHQDAEASATGEAVAKSGKSFFKLPLFLLAALLLWAALPLVRRFGFALSASARPIALPYLRPPLRGPPLLASH